MLGEDAVLANGDLSIPSVAAIDVGESFNGVLDAPPVLGLGDEDTTEDPRERIYSRVELLDVLGGVVVVGSSSSSCTSFKISFATFIMTEFEEDGAGSSGVDRDSLVILSFIDDSSSG